MSEDTLHFHRRATDECLESELPSGMTEEQLDFFTEQTVRAVRKGVRKQRNAAVVGFLVLVVGVVLAFGQATREGTKARETVVQSGRAVAVEGCNRDYQYRADFRALLERLKQASKVAKNSTPEQKAMAVAFYDAQLKKFKLPDCRKSEQLLTDDPNAKIPIVPPFYPGADYAP